MNNISGSFDCRKKSEPKDEPYNERHNNLSHLLYLQINPCVRVCVFHWYPLISVCVNNLYSRFHSTLIAADQFVCDCFLLSLRSSSQWWSTDFQTRLEEEKKTSHSSFVCFSIPHNKRIKTCVWSITHSTHSGVVRLRTKYIPTHTHTWTRGSAIACAISDHSRIFTHLAHTRNTQFAYSCAQCRCVPSETDR